VTEPCKDCKGTGYQKQRRNISVAIPAGIDNGNNIRITGEGDAGRRGGPPGNLYVVVSVAVHKYFNREGDHVLYELPVTFPQAALGDEVEVPTLHGGYKVKIPSGSQSGKIIRLKDQGIPHLHGRGRGEQLVILRVKTPESLTREQRKLFEQLAKSMGPDKEK
jgi:molecular chaperone DnaJ